MGFTIQIVNKEFCQQLPAHLERLWRMLRHSDEAIAELKTADVIVHRRALMELRYTVGIETWIDHIARAGQTFKYSEAGAESLVKNKVVYVAMAAGVVYSSGPYQAFDFVSTYLKAVLGFLGMTNLTVFRVEGSAYPGQAETALQKGIGSIVL